MKKEVKPDIRKLKRGLAVQFDVQNSWNYWKNRILIMQAYFFRGE